MSCKLALTVSALLFAAPPVLAQEVAQTPPAAVTAPAAPVLSEAEIEARGEAFGASMEAMESELEAVVAGAGGDVVKARADSDPIVAKYQVEADAFAAALTAFLAGMAASLPEGEERTQMTVMAPTVEAQIRSAPSQLRDQAVAGMSAPATDATPAAPAAPE